MEVVLERAIPSHVLHDFSVHDSLVANAFPENKRYFQIMEVQRGCGMDLPIVFTYRVLELRDSKLGSWVVSYSKFSAKVRSICFSRCTKATGCGACHRK